MNLIEFRQKYPQYQHVDDDTLTQTLHRKFYADTPFETFKSRFNPDTGWLDEISHGLARGSFKAAASVPGTLATMMEAGSRMPGSWMHQVPAVEAKTKATIRDLRGQARDIYGAASAPSLKAKKGGVGGFIVNAMTETAPVLLASTLAGAATGGVGSFTVGAMTMGESAYQDAIEAGASPEMAETERLIVGLIGGAIEKLQADEILKLNKTSLRTVLKAARQGTWKKLGGTAGRFAVEQLAGAAGEALEEALQEATQVGAGALHGADVFTTENLGRIGMAGVGGFAVGGILKGGRSMFQADPQVNVEPEPVASGPEGQFVTLDDIAVALGPEAVQESPQLQTNVDDSTQNAVAASAVVPQETAKSAQQADLPVTDAAQEADNGKRSARQADVQAGRERMGLSPVERQEARAWERASEMAREQGVQDRAMGIAADLKSSPRAIDDVTTAGLLDKAIELENRYDALDGQITGETDPVQLRELTVERDRAQADYDMLTQALHYSASEKGRALAAQKLTKDREFKLVHVLSKAAALKGDVLTEPERAKLSEPVKELEGVTKEVEKKAEEETKALAQMSLSEAAKHYEGMTDEQKDAELQELLKARKTRGYLARIALNIASRGQTQDLGDVAAEMQKLIPSVTYSKVAESLAGTRKKSRNVTRQMLERLRAVSKEGKRMGGPRNPGLIETAKQLTEHLESGTIPQKRALADRENNDPYAVAATKRLIGLLRQELRNSDAARQQRLTEQIAYLEQRIEEGDFLPRPRRALPPESDELLRLQHKQHKLKRRIQEDVWAMKPKSKLRHFAEVLRVPQALRASFDLSAMLRQGGWMTITHPVRSAKAVPDMLRALRSDEGAWRIEQEIAERSNSARYWKAGLEFTHFDGPLTLREEAFRSALAEKIPLFGRGIRASNRAFSAYLNRVRADSFDTMTDAFVARGRTLTNEEETALADYINICTGRGQIKSQKFRASVDFLNGTLWSSRYVISRFQLAFGSALWGGSGATRKMIVEDYARFVAGMIAAYVLGKMAGGEVEFDPRSSDFGKVQFGDTRVDPLFGLSQTLTFATRIATGETKTSKGELVPLRGEDIRYGGDDYYRVFGRFFRSKLAPTPALIGNLIFGEDVVGGDITAGKVVKDFVLPMSFEDIYDALLEQGIPAGTAFGALAILGAGVQTYGESQPGVRDRR